MEKINITSSHALGDGDVAFVIDAFSGLVLKATVDVAGFGVVPYSFDVIEFRDHYGHLEATIDVLDIGYTLPNGQYEKPAPDFRLRVMREWYFQAMQNLHNLTNVIGSLLRYHGSTMRSVDHHDCDVTYKTARAFMQMVNYDHQQREDTDDDDEEDKSRLPAGIIQALSNEGPCHSCKTRLPMGSRILLDTVKQVCYCTRECFDQHLAAADHPRMVVIPDDAVLPSGVAVFTNHSFVPCWGPGCEAAAAIGDEYLLDPADNKTYCSLACLHKHNRERA